MIRASARELGEGRELLAVVRGEWWTKRAASPVAPIARMPSELLGDAVGFGAADPTAGRSGGSTSIGVDRSAHAAGVARAVEEVAELAGAEPERRPRVAELHRPPQRARRSGRRSRSGRGPGPRVARPGGRGTRSTRPRTRAAAWDSAARSARSASSARGPRSANGAPSSANSSSSVPLPTPSTRRPPLTASSVP